MREHGLDEEDDDVIKMEFYQRQVWWDEEREDHVKVNTSEALRPLRRPNTTGKFDDGYQKILHDYFGNSPLFDEKDFPRRLRMPRTVFQHVYDSL